MFVNNSSSARSTVYNNRGSMPSRANASAVSAKMRGIESKLRLNAADVVTSYALRFTTTAVMSSSCGAPPANAFTDSNSSTSHSAIGFS